MPLLPVAGGGGAASGTSVFNPPDAGGTFAGSCPSRCTGTASSLNHDLYPPRSPLGACDSYGTGNPCLAGIPITTIVATIKAPAIAHARGCETNTRHFQPLRSAASFAADAFADLPESSAAITVSFIPVEGCSTSKLNIRSESARKPCATSWHSLQLTRCAASAAARRASSSPSRYAITSSASNACCAFRSIKFLALILHRHQLIFQSRARPEQTRAHGIHRHAQHHGNFAVTELFVLAQHQDLPFALFQLSQRVAHPDSGIIIFGGVAFQCSAIELFVFRHFAPRLPPFRSHQMDRDSI